MPEGRASADHDGVGYQDTLVSSLPGIGEASYKGVEVATEAEARGGKGVRDEAGHAEH